MELDRIDSVVESLLFANGEPIKIEDICEGLDIQKSEMKSCIKRLQTKFSHDCGIILHKFDNQLQLLTNPNNKSFVEGMLKPIKEKELSRAAMETLAVVAYNQPITKLEIEQFRGVSSDYAMNSLQEYDLVVAVGQKDSIGKPILYGTTANFLKRFALDSLADLPDYDRILDLLQQMQEIKPQEDSTLYNEFELNENTEIPAFLDGEEGVVVIE